MNGKAAITLLVGLLAIKGAQGGKPCTDLDTDNWLILMTVPGIFNTAGDDLEVADASGSSTLVGDKIKAIITSKILAWDATRRNAFDEFLSNDTCIKAHFNQLKPWKEAHPESKDAIIKYLSKKKKLGILDLNSLTDYACKKVIELVSTEKKELDKGHYEALRAGCWTGDVGHAANWNHGHIKDIPAVFFKDSRVKKLVAQGITGTSSMKEEPIYSFMTPPQLKEFIANPENCDVLDEKVLESKPEQAAHLTAACIEHSVLSVNTKAAISMSAKIKLAVAKLTLEALGGLRTFNEGLLPCVTKQQIGALDSANPLPSLRCARINISKTDTAVFGGIDPVCLVGRLNNNASAALGDKYEKLEKDDALKDLNVYDIERVKTNIVGAWDQLKHLKKPAYWSKLLTGPPELCSKFIVPGTDEAFPTNLPEISRACFMAMTQDVQKHFISNKLLIKKLAKDVFATMTSKNFPNDWIEIIINSERPELFQELSSRVPVGELNACSARDAKGTLPPLFIKNASGPCIRSLKNISEIAKPDTPASELKKIPKTLLVALPLEKLLALKNLPSDFFTTLQRPEFIVLTSSPGNCRRFDTPLLGRLPVDNFSSMPLECFLELTVDLAPEKYAKLDTQIVFANVTKDSFQKVRTPHLMSGPQIAAISTKVQPKDHAAHAFTAPIIKAWGADKVGSLTEQSMTLMPETAYDAFVPDLFKALDPKALVGISCTKALKFPPSSFPHITAAQVPSLGRSIAKREDSARCVYTPEVIATVLDDKARDLLSGSTMIVVSLALVGLSILFGMWLV